jgi:hypothetical protein
MRNKWVDRGLIILLFFFIVYIFSQMREKPATISDEIVSWGIFVLVLILVSGGFAYIIWNNKKRREAIEQFAVESGFNYQHEDESFTGLLGTMGNFALFKRGRSRRASNILRSSRRDYEVALFDYRYTTGSGKSSHTHYQTVALFTLGESEFPQFAVRPRNFLDQVAAWFGQKELDFSQRLEFSRKYLVKGEDAAAVRYAINDPFITYYEQQDKLSSEADGKYLIVYRWGQAVKPEMWRTFLDDATRVLEHIRRPRLM